jgi:hypothetical protein
VQAHPIGIGGWAGAGKDAVADDGTLEDLASTVAAALDAPVSWEGAVR